MPKCASCSKVAISGQRRCVNCAMRQRFAKKVSDWHLPSGETAKDRELFNKHKEEMGI